MLGKLSALERRSHATTPRRHTAFGCTHFLNHILHLVSYHDSSGQTTTASLTVAQKHVPTHIQTYMYICVSARQETVRHCVVNWCQFAELFPLRKRTRATTTHTRTQNKKLTARALFRPLFRPYTETRYTVTRSLHKQRCDAMKLSIKSSWLSNSAERCCDVMGL